MPKDSLVKLMKFDTKIYQDSQNRHLQFPKLELALEIDRKAIKEKDYTRCRAF